MTRQVDETDTLITATQVPTRPIPTTVTVTDPAMAQDAVKKVASVRVSAGAVDVAAEATFVTQSSRC
ncbi:MAG: hypothetical protein WA614_08895 [Acidimicrobiales bacterium]